MKKNLFLHSLLGIFLFTFMTIADAMNCDDAKQNITKTVSEIRNNHQNFDSFNLYDQDKVIDNDERIMQAHDYINSVAYFKQICKF